jgi:methyl-accepting chemotaxis protein
MLSWFNNLRMGVKLLVTFIGLSIFIGLALGGISYINLMNINGVLLEITDQRVPSVKNATTVERYALRTSMDEKMFLLAVTDSRLEKTEYLQSAMNNIDQVLAALNELDTLAQNYNDEDLLQKSQEARAITQQYRDLYNSGVEKLTTNTEMAKIMEQNGQRVIDLAKAYYSKVIRNSDEQSLLALPIVVDIWNTTLEMRLNQNKYMMYKDKVYFIELEKGIYKLETLYTELKKVSPAAEDLQKIADAKAATADYFQAAQKWVKNDTELNQIFNEMALLGQTMQESAMTVEDAGWDAVDASKQTSASAVSLALLVTIIAVSVAVGLGGVLGIFISRSITKPLKTVVEVGKALSVGDLVRDMTEAKKDTVRLRRDEIGDLGKAFDRLINYMQEMGNHAHSISENDLTITVHPKSEKDELSMAFQQMTLALNQTINELSESATGLTAASTQLASAANQAGLATGQIAATVQQVARGTADQAQAITKTASIIEQMSLAIRGVAQGAQEQSHSITKASVVTGALTAAIDQVAGNADAVVRDSTSAAEAARNGSKTVEETLNGMQSIKNKVDVSAEKVQEMGKRSKEIGAIVVTIEDIASQTNLLALNAAIEAARAGEHGKGFAVVADEVRKLAERSSSATKEIGLLISGIQKTVAEAVKAMDEGSKEVGLGVSSANKAGEALADILTAAEAVNKQAVQAGEASQQMSASADELVTAVDSVSAVVEENTVATEEMSANSSQVTEAIENIASVSEENSAAIEEVSASAEEMSAQVEEVTASAQSLADMAYNLQQIVNQFKLKV